MWAPILWSPQPPSMDTNLLVMLTLRTYVFPFLHHCLGQEQVLLHLPRPWWRGSYDHCHAHGCMSPLLCLMSLEHLWECLSLLLQQKPCQLSFPPLSFLESSHLVLSFPLFCSNRFSLFFPLGFSSVIHSHVLYSLFPCFVYKSVFFLSFVCSPQKLPLS